MRKLMMMVLAALLFTGCGFEVVDTGHRGVLTKFGEVQGEALPEGLHFYNPFTSDITEMDVRVFRGDNEVSCYSADAQIVKVSTTLNYRPDSTKMHIFYKEVGMDWSEKLLPQILSATIKEEIGKYNAVDLISKRGVVESDIETRVKTLAAEKDIILLNVKLTNLDFSNKFEEAVERKVIAVERAKEAVNKTVEIEEKKKQTILTAEAEAESMRIRAEALSRNKNLVEYEAIKRWDGVLPRIMMGGDGALPFIDVGDYDTKRLEK